MKKLLILAALAAVAFAGIADAQSRRIKPGQFLTWVKGATQDSTSVSVVYTVDQTADHADTTQWFDLTQIKMQPKLVANDSTTVVAAYVRFVGSAAGDTMTVGVESSSDGTNPLADLSYLQVGVATKIVDSYRLTNKVAATNNARFIRWIFTNSDQSTSTVRTVTIQPVVWTAD